MVGIAGVPGSIPGQHLVLSSNHELHDVFLWSFTQPKYGISHNGSRLENSINVFDGLCCLVGNKYKYMYIEMFFFF